MSRISGIVRLYGVVMSNLPAMNASTRVEAFLMIVYSMPSR